MPPLPAPPTPPPPPAAPPPPGAGGPSAALSRLLVGHAVEASYRQLHLHDVVGDLTFRFHFPSHTLRFSVGAAARTLHAFRATILGSDNAAGDFRWAWAAPELPAAARAAAARVRDAGAALGVAELVTPHVAAEGRCAVRRLAMAAAAAVDAPAFFLDYQRGFAVLLDADARVPARRVGCPAEEAERIIESVWAAGACVDSVADALDAFVARRGGVVDKRGGTWLCSVPGASVIEVVLDDRGCVARMHPALVRS